MGNLHRNFKSKEEIQADLEKRFDYLSMEERNKLIYGNDFVEVPEQELNRLRVDVYPYLIM
ncbi:MAG: hypothetical protein E7099_08485 [Mediterranea massiliensis]|nr:hypothetical protein [Mediterranea massiliensis]